MTFDVKPIGKLCAHSGKKKYRTQADAAMIAANLSKPSRAYHCPACDFFHVSSKREMVDVEDLMRVGPRVMQRVVASWTPGIPPGDPYEMALRTAIDAAKKEQA